MKTYIKILILSFTISCQAQDKDQTDNLAYCNYDLYLGDLQINTSCNKKTPTDYSISEIKQSFNVPITKEISKVADENTGGNSTYWDFVFKDSSGKLSLEIYDSKLPEFYLTHSNIPVTIGSEVIKVGDSISKLKSFLNTRGFKKQGNNTLFIFIDYNVVTFGIENNSIKYIAFNGNYF